MRRVDVDGFWMDAHPVTAADFRRFVARPATSRSPSARPIPTRYPDADPELLVPGSLVFLKPPWPGPPR